MADHYNKVAGWKQTLVEKINRITGKTWKYINDNELQCVDTEVIVYTGWQNLYGKIPTLSVRDRGSYRLEVKFRELKSGGFKWVDVVNAAIVCHDEGIKAAEAQKAQKKLQNDNLSDAQIRIYERFDGVGSTFYGSDVALVPDAHSSNKYNLKVYWTKEITDLKEAEEILLALSMVGIIRELTPGQMAARRLRGEAKIHKV